MKPTSVADVCLILEGAYPYVTGGLSTWTHHLIQRHHDLNFKIVSLLPSNFDPIIKYEIPKNVLSIENIFLQNLPEGETLNPKLRKKLFESLEVPLLNLQHSPNLDSFSKIINSLNEYEGKIGRDLLFRSQESWQMLVRMYLSTLGEGSFINFFWSYWCLLGGFYSVLLYPMAQAKVYHALCTGFAGLFLARAKVETGNPCILTEHGIYTNERKIEIASAEWLENSKGMDLNLDVSLGDRDLKDYWSDMFTGYSKLCYEASDVIVTLFEGNKEFQIKDGADLYKMMTIPNGVEIDKFKGIERSVDHPKTIAFIGRVVSIKDVKSFIRAVLLVKMKIPDIQAFIMGPTDEEPDYYQDCLELIEKLNLGDTIRITGKVDLKEYLGKIDLLVLTSISEAQPLVILEAGSIGIPCVATDVGACRELIFGRSDEDPKLGAGGVICKLANPESIANGIYELLSSESMYKAASEAIKNRVAKYYQIQDQEALYRKLYSELKDRSL